MKPLKYLILLVIGCSTPSGRLVDSDAAVDQILIAYHFVAGGNRPAVYMVEDEHCYPDGMPGFVDPNSNKCVRGLYVQFLTHGNIYITKPGTNRLHDTSLAHEVRHWLGFQHPGLGTWPQGSWDRIWIDIANAALAEVPQADTIDLETECGPNLNQDPGIRADLPLVNPSVDLVPTVVGDNPGRD